MTASIAIVEDDQDLSDDLSRLIGETVEFRVVCTCRTVRNALKKLPLIAPDIIIMDIQLPDGTGIECTAKLRRQLPTTRVVMFTVAEDDEKVFEALKAGASGYLLKGAEPARILEGLRQARDGGAPLSDCIARKVVESFSRPISAARSTMDELTPREHEVLGNLARGWASKEIAAKLCISTETVNFHLKQIYQKLQVNSRTEAVVKYLRLWPNAVLHHRP